jgi:hypothetical protein
VNKDQRQQHFPILPAANALPGFLLSGMPELETVL